MAEFIEFPKIARFSRDIIVTEKIDGTNSSIFIQHAALEVEEENGLSILHSDPTILAIKDNYTIRAGSKSKWITPKDDNFGFASWVKMNSDCLFDLGEGHHFGEWWGSGIQRVYGLSKADRRFSLFNTVRWGDEGTEKRPDCCSVTPILYQGEFCTFKIKEAFEELEKTGSKAAPGFMKPEGIIIYHTAADMCFKKTFEKDEGKWF